MKTIMNYLSDPECFSLPCHIVAVEPGTEPGHSVVVLDRSPFYAQGGGQPSDIGHLAVAGDGQFDVTLVKTIDGVTRHFVRGYPVKGSAAQAIVDDRQRRLHSRLHTAGELLCGAVKKLQPDWLVSSAIHFPGASSVTFTPGHVPDLDRFEREVTAAVQQYVAHDFEILILGDVDRNEAERMVGYSLRAIPETEPIRLVNPIPGYYRACMGTHCRRTSDVARFEVRKAKLKKGLVVVSYELDEEQSPSGSSANIMTAI